MSKQRDAERHSRPPAGDNALEHRSVIAALAAVGISGPVMFAGVALVQSLQRGRARVGGVVSLNRCHRRQMGRSGFQTEASFSFGAENKNEGKKQGGVTKPSLSVHYEYVDNYRRWAWLTVQTTSATISAMTSTQKSSMNSPPNIPPPIRPPLIMEPIPPIPPLPEKGSTSSRTRMAPPNTPRRTFKTSLTAFTSFLTLALYST